MLCCVSLEVFVSMIGALGEREEESARRVKNTAAIYTFVVAYHFCHGLELGISILQTHR
jgi:hypothetical protein